MDYYWILRITVDNCHTYININLASPDVSTYVEYIRIQDYTTTASEI